MRTISATAPGALRLAGRGQGIVRLAYRRRDPADRPPVSRLLDALREAADTPAP